MMWLTCQRYLQDQGIEFGEILAFSWEYHFGFYLWNLKVHFQVMKKVPKLVWVALTRM